MGYNVVFQDKYTMGKDQIRIMYPLLLVLISFCVKDIQTILQLLEIYKECLIVNSTDPPMQQNTETHSSYLTLALDQMTNLSPLPQPL
jgi:hypothetical protein